ncbi:flagellar protein FlgN [Paenibacillus flagellatus]|uniref:Flagellar protein FlgN n=1 Tax=Paenibacillus flagellatus TaxID=2211139 RepID=A0A2V5JWI7_9BACL|nr:flagellar protein FlgN [Paenibacillus flagellatus]PYI51175.1 flagellar protein FlgN [Paenibacillus flagellatus]
MEAILHALDQLIEVHRALLEWSERKKDAIVHNRVEELTQITNKESRLAKRLEELEAERVEAVNAYMRSKNMYVTAAISISTLIRFVVRMEDKQALTERQQELVRLIEELKRANDTNRQLIQQSLAFINYSLDLLVGPDDDAVYHHPQQQQTYQPNRMFDRKA